MTRQETRDELADLKDEMEEKLAELIGYREDVRRCKEEIAEIRAKRNLLKSTL